MTALKEVFASKLHPDNTITRIERLENQLRDLQKKLERRDENIDLNQRLKVIDEKVNQNHEIRVSDIENRLQVL